MSQEIHFSLPWPHSSLNANTRVHWRRRAELTRKARHDAAILTRQAIAPATDLNSWLCGQPARRIDVHLAFAPPNRRRRDPHNILCKAEIDGIADALGVDDVRFRVSHEMLDRTGGEVLVTIKAEA